MLHVQDEALFARGCAQSCTGALKAIWLALCLPSVFVKSAKLSRCGLFFSGPGLWPAPSPREERQPAAPARLEPGSTPLLAKPAETDEPPDCQVGGGSVPRPRPLRGFPPRTPWRRSSASRSWFREETPFNSLQEKKPLLPPAAGKKLAGGPFLSFGAQGSKKGGLCGSPFGRCTRCLERPCKVA